MWRITMVLTGVLVVCSASCADDTSDPKPAQDGSLPDQKQVDQGAVDVRLELSMGDTMVPDQAIDTWPPSAWKPSYTSTGSQLLAIWGEGTNQLFVVGKGGVILYNDGNAWQEMSSPTTDDLYAVWGTFDSKSAVYAAGDDVILRLEGLTPSPDGGSGYPYWSEDYDGYTKITLRGIWGSSSANVWAVGDKGEVQHRASYGWDSVYLSGIDEDLNAIFGFSTNEIFIVGDKGTILKKGSGDDWTPMESGTTSNLTSIWGTSPTDLYAVGLDGTVLHYNGTKWSQQSTGTTTYFYSVWGSSASDIYAVGESIFEPDTAVMHYDGSKWSAFPPPISSGFSGVWGSSASDVYLIGKQLVLHYDGTKP